MKNIIIMLILFISTFAIAEDTALIWSESDGKIISHGPTIVSQNNWVKCGDVKLKEFDKNVISAGTVAIWVEDATNTNELGAITVIDWDDLQDDASQSPVDIRALIDSIAQITGTSTNDVKAIFKDKKKKIKKEK